jgi:hypothetical protein
LHERKTTGNRVRFDFNHCCKRDLRGHLVFAINHLLFYSFEREFIMSAEEKEQFRNWFDNMHSFGLFLHVRLKSAVKLFRASMAMANREGEERICEDADQ